MNINKMRKYVNIVIFIIVVVVGYLLDNGLSEYLPKWILIDNDIKYDLKSYVFSSQVSVSTLGIALVAILGGLFKEEIYGINILKYLTNDKPLIFKHKTSIIMQLILIFVSYICVAFDKYNMLIMFFAISILITIIMILDIFSVFKGYEYLKNEIFNYILDVFKSKLDKNKLHQNIIIGLRKDTLLNIENNNTSILKDNLYLFNSILGIIVDYNDKDKKIILELFEDSVSDIFNEIFEEKDSNKVFIALKSISSFYKTCNDSNSTKDNNKTYINIYEKVYYKIFSAIAIFVIEDRTDQNIIINLQYDLYNNMNFDVIQGNIFPKNNIHLSLYSGRIYYEIKRKRLENYSIENLHSLKKKLFTTLRSYIEYYNFDEFKVEKIGQIYVQLYQYTKVLIDNNEKYLLNTLFFNNMSDVFYETIDKKYYLNYVFIILIYLYYLIEFENLVDKKFKDEMLCLIEFNKNNINDFLLGNCDFEFDKSIIDNIKNFLNMWEKMPEEGAKFIIMDSVVEKFIILYSLSISWNGDVLMNKLRPLVENNGFSIYNEVSNQSNILEEYIRFNSIFLGKEILREKAKNDITKLQYAVSKLYKYDKLNRSNNEIRSEEEYNTLKNKISEKILQSLQSKVENFNNNHSIEVISDTIPLFKAQITTDFTLESLISNIVNQSESLFVSNIINIVSKNLRKESISRGDKDLIVNFFELYDSIGLETDTLIGYHNYFYDEKDIDKFIKFEKNKIKLESRYKRDCIITIDSKKFYIDIKDVLVKIEKINIDDLVNRLNFNKDGSYMYNITNDIYLPFTREELETYLNNKIRKITIDINIEYYFKDECIGCGIFIV